MEITTMSVLVTQAEGAARLSRKRHRSGLDFRFYRHVTRPLVVHSISRACFFSRARVTAAQSRGWNGAQTAVGTVRQREALSGHS